jgi:hypothetical protein
MKRASAAAATRIIAQFGGPTNLSRRLSEHYGEKTPKPAAIGCWQNVGIPVKWQHEVLYVAKLAGIGLAPEDFFEVPQ